MAFDPMAAVREWKQKVASLQERWRGARQENEELRKEIEQLRRRLEQINSDFDLRFSQGQGQPATASPRSAGSGAVTSAAAGTLSLRGAAPTTDRKSVV